MKNPAIRKITVLGTSTPYNSDIAYERDVDGITEIIDKSLEYKSSLESIIYIMKGDSIFIEIVNAPMIIEHFN